VDTFGTGAGNGDGWAVGQDGSGNVVMVHYDGASWTVVPTSPSLVAGSTSPGLGLRSVSLTNPQDGWAVGAGVTGATNPLAGIFHLDPPTPPVVGQVTTSTAAPSTVTVYSTVGSSNSTSAPVASTTSSTNTTLPYVVTTTPVATTVVSTAVSTVTVENTPTTTVSSSTSSVSTPVELPAIPGFPWESIIAGLILGVVAIAVLRRVKRK